MTEMVISRYIVAKLMLELLRYKIGVLCTIIICYLVILADGDVSDIYWSNKNSLKLSLFTNFTNKDWLHTTASDSWTLRSIVRYLYQNLDKLSLT